MKLLDYGEVIQEVGSQIRVHFNNLVSSRPTILELFNNSSEEMRDFALTNWELTPSLGPYPVVENNGYLYLLRKKEGGVTWIPSYDIVHLRSSLIANFLIPENQGDMRTRLDKIIYMFYHYWFFKKEADIDSLTHNVCFELQEIIKQIIDKELTLYRDYPTAELIDAVRWRLSSERLLLMARIQTINLRKSK